VGFAVDVEDGGGGICAEADCAVLVAYAFEGDALFEVGVEGDGSVGVASLFEDVDPAVFEAFEALGVVGGVGELDVAGLGDGDRTGLVFGGGEGVGVGAGGAGLGGVELAGRGVRQRDAVVGVGEVFGCEPPGDGVSLHGFKDETGGEGWGVAFHHFVVEAADGLDLAEGEGVVGVGVAEVEVVGAPGFHVAVAVGDGGEGEEGVGLVVHEVAADLVGGVGEAGGVLVVGGLEEEDGGVYGACTDGDDVGFVVCG
jgi:hypothetical protein